MFHIRSLRVRLRGRMRYAPTAGYPAKLRRRPQTPSAILAGVRRRPPKQRGRHAPSETPVSAACWRTTRPSQEYYFPHYMRRTDPATGIVTGIVHMAPPSTMPPSVGGCGRRRSLAGYRPYGYQANFAGARRRPRPYFAAGRIPPSSSPSTSWCAAVGRSIAGPERRAAKFGQIHAPQVPGKLRWRP